MDEIAVSHLKRKRESSRVNGKVVPLATTIKILNLAAGPAHFHSKRKRKISKAKEKVRHPETTKIFSNLVDVEKRQPTVRINVNSILKKDLEEVNQLPLPPKGSKWVRRSG